jgi:hypothetical protein
MMDQAKLNEVEHVNVSLLEKAEILKRHADEKESS